MSRLQIRSLGVRYAGRPAIQDVNWNIEGGTIAALIGPSGCGKSSLLAALNRMADLVPGCTVDGSVLLDGKELLGPAADPVEVRRRVGMIFQRPNPFAMSIAKNLEMPLAQHGVRGRADRRDLAEAALRNVGLWDEVSGRLRQSALSLSGGQQQRLCIARALVLRPSVLLLDEPCSALDPLSTQRIEELMTELRGGCCSLDADSGTPLTQIVVTHNLAQARRIADHTAMVWMRAGYGQLIESGPTQRVFEQPSAPETGRYVRGEQG